jgi:hypothetical protein
VRLKGRIDREAHGQRRTGFREHDLRQAGDLLGIGVGHRGEAEEAHRQRRQDQGASSQCSATSSG